MIEQDIHPWCRVLSWCFSEVWVYTQFTAHLYTCTPVTLYPVSHVSTLIFVHSTFNMYCSLDECDDWLDPELIWFLAKMFHLDAFWDDGCFSSHWSSALNCWHINIEWKQSELLTSGLICEWRRGSAFTASFSLSQSFHYNQKPSSLKKRFKSCLAQLYTRALSFKKSFKRRERFSFLCKFGEWVSK